MIDFNEIILNGGGVYAIVNIRNYNIYIGATQSFKTRLKRHISLLSNNKHHCEHLQNSFNKYGVEVFEIKILEIATPMENLWECEKYWWNFYNNNDYILFNGKPNGAGRPTIEPHYQSQINEKISTTMKNKFSRGERKNGWECMINKYGFEEASRLKYSFDEVSAKRAGEATRQSRTRKHNENISESLKNKSKVKIKCIYCEGEYSQGAGISRHQNACKNNF